MVRTIRTLLTAITLLALIVVTAAALALALFDPNAHKDTIARWLSRQVGSEVRIQGGAHLSLYPWFGLSMAGVRVEDAPGFGQHPFLEAGAAVVRIRLASFLMDGEVELDRLVFINPVVRLRRAAHGATNWTRILERAGFVALTPPPHERQAPTLTAPSAPPGPPDPQGLFGLARTGDKTDGRGRPGLRGVSLHNATVRWMDEVAGIQLVVDQLTLETSPGLHFEFSLDGRLQSAGLSGRFNAAGEADLSRAGSGGIAGPQFALQGTRLEFEGETVLGGRSLRGEFSGVLDLDTEAGVVALRQATLQTEGAVLAGDMTTTLPSLSGGAHGPPGAMTAEHALASFLEGDGEAQGAVRVEVSDPDILEPLFGEDFARAFVAASLPDTAGSKAAEPVPTPALPEDGDEAARADAGVGTKPKTVFETHARLADGLLSLNELRLVALGAQLTGRADISLGAPVSAPGAGDAVMDAAFLDLDVFDVAMVAPFFSGSGESAWLEAFMEEGRLLFIPAGRVVRVNLGVGRASGPDLALENVALDLQASREGVEAAMTSGGWRGLLEGAMRIAPAGVKLDGVLENVDLGGFGAFLERCGAGKVGLSGVGSGTVDWSARSLAFFASGDWAVSGDVGEGDFLLDEKSDAHIGFGDASITFERVATGRFGEVSLRAEAEAARLVINGQEKARLPSLRMTLEGPWDLRAPGFGRLDGVDAAVAVAGKDGEWSLPFTQRLERGVGQLAAKVSGRITRGPGSPVRFEGLAAEFFGLQVKGDGVLDASGPAWSLDGTFALPQFEPRVCMAYVGLEPPRRAEPGSLQTCVAQGRITAAPDFVKLDELNITLDQSAISGWAHLNALGGPDVDAGWSVNFDLQADRFDADRYLFGESAAPEPDSPEKWSLDFLQDLRVNGRLGVSRLGLFGLDFVASDMALTVRDGGFVLDHFRAGFYGGRLGLSMSGEGVDELELVMDAELLNVDLGAVLAEMGGGERMDGVCSVELRLRSKGRSSREHLNSLAGAGRVKAHKGFFAYAKPPQDKAASSQWVEAMNRLKPDEAPEPEIMIIPVEAAEGAIRVENGVVRNDDFRMTGSLLDATGSGWLHIPRGEVDYTLLVDARIMPVFPVTIQGAVADPDVEQGSAPMGEAIFSVVRGLLSAPFQALGAITRRIQE